MNREELIKEFESYSDTVERMQMWLDESEQENKQLKDKLIEIKKIIDGYMPNKHAMCMAFDEIEFIIKEALKEVK